MYNGLKKFQKDAGLKVDGVMKRGGPTERGLNKALNDNSLGDTLFAKKKPEGKVSPFSITGPAPWFETASLPEIPGESVSSNTRTLNGLLKYAKNGSLPKYQADALSAGKSTAIGEYGNFLQQLQKRAPERVKGFEDEVMERLPASAKAILDPYRKSRTANKPRAGKLAPAQVKSSVVAPLLQASLKLTPVSQDAVSSNARTVKAARKTVNHTNLARLHANAIRDFGDKALLEVADFKDQLLQEDGKTHNNWWRAFEDEAPDLAKKLLATLEDDEEEPGPEPDNPDPEKPDEPEPDEPNDPDPEEPNPEEPDPKEPDPDENDCSEIESELEDAENYLADIEKRGEELNSQIAGTIQRTTDLNREYQELQTALANTYLHEKGAKLFPWTRRMKRIAGPNREDMAGIRMKLRERLANIKQELKNIKEERKRLMEEKKGIEQEIKEARSIVTDIRQALAECQASKK